jgi:hypothetical protein
MEWIEEDVHPRFSNDDTSFKFLDNFSIEDHSFLTLNDKNDVNYKRKSMTVQNSIGDFSIEESSHSWKEDTSKKSTKKKKSSKKRQSEDPKEKGTTL